MSATTIFTPMKLLPKGMAASVTMAGIIARHGASQK